MTTKSEKQFLIRVKADIEQALRDLQKLPVAVDRTADASQESASNINSMGRSLQFLTRAAAAYISVRTVQSLVTQADAFNVLTTRIRTATKSTGDFEAVQRRLFEITQQNGQAFDITVSLFQSLARSAPELQATNQEVLTLVNLVQQLGVISGASQSNQRAGLLQFTQGLAAGVFRAEEFNSLLENIPEVANRIARGLGVSVGELRKMVLDGQLLSNEVFNSLLKQSEEINQEFQEIPESVDRASTRLGNSISQWLSDLDKSAGITRTLARTMNRVSDALSDTARPIAEIRKDIEGVTAAIERQEQIGITGNSEFLESRLRSLREELNQSLISSGAVEGVRLRIQQIEDEISGLETDRAEGPGLLERIMLGDKAGQTKNNKIDAQIAASRSELQELLALLEQLELDDDTGESDAQPVNNEQNNIDSFISKLQDEQAALGRTREELVAYRLEKLGATEDEITLARTIAASTQAYIDHEAALEDGKRVYDETRTSTEKLANELDRLQRLYDQGAFGPIGSDEAFDTLARATFDAEENFEDLKEKGTETFDELVAATRGWGAEFTNTLADAVQQGKLDFSSLADSIIADLLRISIYEGITSPLFQSLGIPGFNANVQHSGGFAGTGPTRNVSPLLFAGARRYHNGGPVGLRPDEVPAILQRGEYVLRKDQVAAAGVPGKPARVEIVNRGAPAQISDSNVRYDAEGMVIRIITENVQRGGPLRGLIKSTAKE